jgi:predicted dehydrogenase
MIQATDRAGVTFMVAQDLRYLPYTRAVKRLIQEGELGQIRAARCDSLMNTMQACPPGHWMLDGERAGGGVLITLTIHMIDLLRYYVGDVRRVTGVCKSVWSAMKNGAEDYACATLEFENGAIGTAFAIWTVSRSPTGIQYMLFGDNGALYTSSPTPETRLQQVGPAMVSSPKRDETRVESATWFSRFVPVEPLREGLAGDNPFINEILHFAQCCQEGKEPISSGKDNLGTIKVILGIYESARTGRAVDLATL